jgi:predicted membrane metal-binding protein
MSTHEQLTPQRKVVVGSERSFGLVFAAVFAVIGLWPPIMHGASVRLWALGVALAFFGLALLAPKILAPLNRLWFRFGLVLHHVVNPLVMGLIYYGAIVPTGLLVKAAGKDLLRLKREPDAPSYWIAREPPGPERGSMSKQF